MKPLLVRRSTLIVPVIKPRFVEKAHLRGADAIQLDLEDSVPAHRKAEAREALAGAVAQVGRAGADVLVRINRPWELAYPDLDAAVIPGVRCIVLPKTDAPKDVYALDRLIEERELARGLPPGSVEIAVKLESAKGLLRAEEIAQASARIATISPGTEDFANDLELELTDEGTELTYSRAHVVVVAAAYGLEPTGLLGRTSDYRDLSGFRNAALRARRLGYRGASCIHPAQVAVLNEVFSPTAGQLERARRLIEAAAGSTEEAAFGFEGRMADIPTVARAQRLLARAARIAEREAAAAAATAHEVTGTSAP
jgi:citrate lyase subunit beta/citryl-CoA lyase